MIASLCCNQVLGQGFSVNLVENGSFEQHYGCPADGTGLSQLNGWSLNFPSPDYYHICGDSNQNGIPHNSLGYQPIDEDSAYVGLASYTSFFSGFQESLVANFVSPLVAGVKYRVRFEASYANKANYAVCCVGAVISDTPPPPPPFTQNLSSVELIVPENQFDTTSWFVLDLDYTALGGEDKIYIGTFRPEDDMNFYEKEKFVTSQKVAVQR